jgi:dihydropteroate synthase
MPDYSQFDSSWRFYVRPINFIDSPQQHDGAGSNHLAGGLIYYTGVELIAKSVHGKFRWLLNNGDWEDDGDERIKRLNKNLTDWPASIKFGSRNVRLDQPQVMGILNVTPDSFSDGGKHDGSPDEAAAAGIAMAAAGAAIIDVGGESTRPGAPLVWEGDEIKRVRPVVEMLAAAGTAVSVDTRKASVMADALTAGAGMINDVSALLYDDQSLAAVKDSDCAVVLMHAPSQSSDPHKGGVYDDVLLDVYDWLDARVEAVVAAGIARERILIDPGIGFGKSLTDNLTLINNLAIFHGIGCPIVFGASRKRMIGALSNEAPAGQRLGGSLYLAMKAVEQGAHIVRVHDVAETVQAIHVWRGLRDAALTAKRP